MPKPASTTARRRCCCDRPNVAPTPWPWSPPCAVLLRTGWMLADAFRLVRSRQTVVAMTDAQVGVLRLLEVHCHLPPTIAGTDRCAELSKAVNGPTEACRTQASDVIEGTSPSCIARTTFTHHWARYCEGVSRLSRSSSNLSWRSPA
jgi:hypothetical protein